MSRLTIVGVEMQAVEVDAQRHQHTQAKVDRLQRLEAYCELTLYNTEKEVQHFQALVAVRAVWVASSLCPHDILNIYCNIGHSESYAIIFTLNG